MRPTRREFFGLAAAAAALSGAAPRSRQDNRIPARFIGDALERGHHWLTPDPTKLHVDRKEKARVVIVGGGIAGVVAACRLAEAGVDDFVLLELEDKAGGLARNGMMGKTVVPFGGVMMAPPGDATSPAVLRVLDLAKPDRALSPFPSLVFADGSWRPFDVDATLPAFALGAASSSRAADLLFSDPKKWKDALDSQTIAEFIRDGLDRDRAGQSTFVARWCLTRFGVRPHDVSADAFWQDVGRRFRGTPESRIGGLPGPGDMRGHALVVPGGCGSLLAPMLTKIGPRLLPARVAVLVKSESAGALVRAVNALDASATDYAAEAVVLALPPFIARRITPGLRERDHDLTLPDTTPWLVTAFQVSEWPAGFDSGTVFHQAADERAAMIVHAGSPPDAVIVTQRPFPASVANPARMFLRDLDPDEARDWSFRELEKVFPDLRRVTRSVELWRVGHGSTRPAPGFATKIAPRIREPLGRIHPCGADYTGLPSMESAIEDGVRGAEAVLKDFGKLEASWLR